MDVAPERSSTRTAILRSSGLTEKKLTVVGPPGTVVTSAALPGGTTSRILVSPSRKYTSSVVADTAGGWTAPSCAVEQNWTEEGAIAMVAHTVASGLTSSSMPAEMVNPYVPLSGPALLELEGEVEALPDASAEGEANGVGD